MKTYIRSFPKKNLGLLFKINYYRTSSKKKILYVNQIRCFISNLTREVTSGFWTFRDWGANVKKLSLTTIKMLDIYYRYSINTNIDILFFENCMDSQS